MKAKYYIKYIRVTVHGGPLKCTETFDSIDNRNLVLGRMLESKYHTVLSFGQWAVEVNIAPVAA